MEKKSSNFMKKRLVLVGVLFVLPVTSFAEATTPAAAKPSPADCQAYANRIEMDAGSTGRGAAGGAVKGAAFGAIVGDSSKATKRGAALGGVMGGARSKNTQSNTYKNAYDNCMAGKVQF